MAKRVFIIHGWDGYPGEGWFPWLKNQLEERGFKVFVPAMPEAGQPTIERWVPFLANLVGTPDEQTYFVGHSSGCQTIIRYLATIDATIGGAVFVAGFVTLTPLATREEENRKIAEPWLTTPIDFGRARRTSSNFVAIFSDNDEWVPPENARAYEEQLGAKTIVEHAKGHFSGSDGVTELPSALEALLSMTS